MPSIILSNVFDYQALLDTEFSTYLVKQNASEITRKNYVTDIRSFFKWLNNCITVGSIALHENTKKPLQSITTEIIESFKRSLITSKTPVATINRRLSALRMFFQFAVLTQKTTENPMTIVRNIPRTDAPYEANTLDIALKEYAEQTSSTQSDVDDIRTFFSWYHEQYSS